MLFNSFPFLFLFLPISIGGFFAASAAGRATGRAWLVFASLAFYTWWHPAFTVLLLISIAFNYGCGRLLLAGAGRDSGRTQGALLAAALACNLGALFYYKYAYAVVAGLAGFGVIQSGWMDAVLLPLGISFFTFTQIGFLVDCRSGAVQDRGLVDYLLFVTFFPHLIAGPILHHREIMPQFARAATYRLHLPNLAQGLALFFIGLFKKGLIADPISASASPGFADPASLDVLGAWGAALAYSMQLYFDFSGYSDMAIGIALMCNVHFPFNFNSPYKARNIIDFWQRWHMTLTRYLTLSLYNPIALSVTRRRATRGLATNRQAAAKPGAFASMIAMPMVVTMALAGIWHGAGWQFLVFGLLHAAYLTVNHAWRVFGPRPAQHGWLRGPAWGVLCLVVTYLAVLVAQIFFRAGSVADAWSMLLGMAGWHGASFVVPVPPWVPGLAGAPGAWLQARGWIAPAENGGDWMREVFGLALAFGLVFFTPNSQEIVGLPALGAKPVRGATPRAWLRMDARWGIVAGLVAVAGIMSIGAKSEFLYFQF